MSSAHELKQAVADGRLAIVLLNLAADAVIVGSLFWGWGLAAAVYGMASLIPVLGLFFNRVDAWSTAAAVLAVAGWRRDRPIILGCALAIGTAFKLWPLVLATLLIVPWRRRQSLVALAAFAATALVLGGAAVWIAGSNGVMQVLTFRGATGWQIESLVGSLVHLTDSTSLRMESGAWRIGTINSTASIAMFLAAAPICLWSSWRGIHPSGVQHAGGIQRSTRRGGRRHAHPLRARPRRLLACRQPGHVHRRAAGAGVEIPAGWRASRRYCCSRRCCRLSM